MIATHIERVRPARWRDTVSDALDSGERFAAAWATPLPDGVRWRALLTGPDARRVVECDAPGGRVDTIVDVVPAATWDEREAHDRHGLLPDGHEPLRPLVSHPEDLTEWTTPVSGDGVHQVAVGPVHAGVIESGHFRFHVVGERILALDLRLFYKHRGLEAAAAGHDTGAALAHAQRACAACAVANTLAFAHAVEDARGLEPDRDLRAGRTLLSELERLYNHLHDLGAVCAGVGFAPGSMAFAALKDRAQRLNASVTGHRFGFGSIAIGRSTVELDRTATTTALTEVRALRVRAAEAWRALEFASTVQARLDGIGVLDLEHAVRLGAVGPAARAAGVAHDVRSESPGLWYGDFAAATVPGSAGDVAARVRMRAAELEATFSILEDLLQQPLGPGGVTAARAPAALGIGRVESPRGATVCAVDLDGDRVERLHLRSGSYANWPAVAHASAGSLLPDFPLINKSFELCYACVDR